MFFHLAHGGSSPDASAVTTIFSALVVLLLGFLPLKSSAESCAGVLLQSIATRWDSLGTAYQNEICARGCQPVMSTWDDWTYSNAFIPLIDMMAHEMSLSNNFKTTFTRIGQDIATATKNECSALLAPGQHFCTSGDIPAGNKLAQWNRCFKKQVAKQATRNAFTMLRLVSSEICKGSAYKYLSEDALWTEVLPQYMRKYADVCRAPNTKPTAGGLASTTNGAAQSVQKTEAKDEL